MSVLRFPLAAAAVLLVLHGPAAAQSTTVKSEARLDPYGDPLPAEALARLGPARWRVSGFVASATASSDGKYIAYTNNRMDITVADRLTGKTVRSLKANFLFLGNDPFVISPDNKYLAGPSGNNSVVLLDLETGKQVRQIKSTAPNRMSALAFSANGKVLAAASDSFNKSPTASFFDPETGNELASCELLHNYNIKLAVSADGKMGVTCGNYLPRGGEKMPDAASTIQLWDLATGKEHKRIKTDGVIPAAVALSPDAKHLAFVSGGATVRLLEIETGKEMRRFPGRRGMGAMLAFSPDGKTLCAAGDGSVLMWETATGKRTGAFPIAKVRGGSFVFPPEGQPFVWGVDGQAIRMWELPAGKELTHAVGHFQPVASLAFVDRGKQLASASMDGRVCWWDCGAAKEIRTTLFQDDDALRYGGAYAFNKNTLALAPTGHYLVGATSYAGAARLWDLRTKQVLCDLEGGPGGGAQAVAFAPDGSAIAVAFRDRSVRWWDVETAIELASAKITEGECKALVLSPDRKLVAFAATYFDRNAKQQMNDILVVEAATGAKVAEWKRAGYYLGALAFSPDSKTLAAAGPAAVGLLDVRSGKEQAVLPLNQQITALAFSPDGRNLAVGASGGVNVGPGGTVLLYELATRGVRRAFAGHGGMIDCLLFAPDGRVLASAGSDTTILLWDCGGRLLRDQNPPAWDEKDLERWWTDLSRAEAEQAYAAVKALASTPRQTVPLLRARVKPSPAVQADPADIAKWIRDLDDPKFAVRDKAQSDLAKVGEAAAAALRQALAGKPTEETRRRLEALLAKVENQPWTPERLQEARAVEVLEFIANDEARALLGTLADGSPPARAALKRLEGIAP